MEAELRALYASLDRVGDDPGTWARILELSHRLGQLEAAVARVREAAGRAGPGAAPPLAELLVRAGVAIGDPGPVHPGASGPVAGAPDRPAWAFATAGGEVVEVDPASGAVRARYRLPGAAWQLAFRPDGQGLWGVRRPSDDAPALEHFDSREPGTPVRTTPLPVPVRGPVRAVSPSGRHVVLGGAAPWGLVSFPTGSGPAAWRELPALLPERASFSPAGRYLLVLERAVTPRPPAGIPFADLDPEERAAALPLPRHLLMDVPAARISTLRGTGGAGLPATAWAPDASRLVLAYPAGPGLAGATLHLVDPSRARAGPGLELDGDPAGLTWAPSPDPALGTRRLREVEGLGLVRAGEEPGRLAPRLVRGALLRRPDEEPPAPLCAVEVLPEAGLVVLIDRTGLGRIHDLARGQPIARIFTRRLPGRCGRFPFHPAGHWQLQLEPNPRLSHRAVLDPLRPGAARRKLVLDGLPAGPEAADLDPVTPRLAVAAGGKVTVFDLEADRRLGAFPVPGGGPVLGLRLLPGSGGLLVLTGTSPPGLLLLEGATGAPRWQVHARELATRPGTEAWLAVRPGSAEALLGLGDHLLAIRLADGHRSLPLRGPPGAGPYALSPDGKELARVDPSGALERLDLAAPTPVERRAKARLPPPPERPAALAYGPDGRTLLYTQGTWARLWSLP